MKITYDPTADAIYIQLSDRPRKRGARKVTPDFILDFDTGDNVRGIEILSASQSVDNPFESVYAVLGQIPVQKAGASDT